MINSSLKIIFIISTFKPIIPTNLLNTYNQDNLTEIELKIINATVFKRTKKDVIKYINRKIQ